MTDHNREAEQRIAVEDRHEHENIGQVHTALIGIVEDHRIARDEAVAVKIQHNAHRLGHGAEMQRHGFRLGDHIALRVADGGRIIHHVLDDFRPRGADDVVGHFVHDRIEAVLDDGEGDRIDIARSAGIHIYCSITLSGTSITRLPQPSLRAVAPGGRTIVVS